MLTAVGFGQLINGQLIATGVGVPPPTVVVTSTAGGSAVATVQVVGPANAPLIAVVADAGSDRAEQVDTVVTLNGSASTGPIAAYLWAQASDTPDTLNNANSAVATFMAPAATGPLTFTLTVSGSAGASTDTDTDTDTVSINLLQTLPAPAADADQTTLVGNLVTLNGNASKNTTSHSWTQTAGPAVTLTGANTATPSFAFPNSAGPVTLELTAAGPGGTPSKDTVNITATLDSLTVTRLDYTISKTQWRINGSASVLNGNQVTVYSESLLTGTIGTTDVDPATGLFALTVRPSSVPGPAGTRVNVISSRGGESLNLPITRFRLDESGDGILELEPAIDPFTAAARIYLPLITH